MGEAGEAKKLVLVIVDRAELVDELLTGFLDIGVPGATVLESRGMGSIIKQEMPMFAGLASLFPEHTGSRVIISVLPESVIEKVHGVLDELIGRYEDMQSVLCATLPVDECHIRRKASE